MEEKPSNGLKQVIIKFWQFDYEDEFVFPGPAITTKYIIDLELAGIDGFKEIARDHFEKILNKWGEAEHEKKRKY